MSDLENEIAIHSAQFSFGVGIIVICTTDGTHPGEKYLEQQKEHDVCRRISTFAICVFSLFRFHWCVTLFNHMILICISVFAPFF